MTRLFRLDPTFSVGPKGPMTLGAMIGDATPPAQGVARIGGGSVVVNLCGASAYLSGESVVIVAKDDGAWAIKESGTYYPSRRWVPISQWVPRAKASRAVLWMLNKCRRRNLYEVVTVADENNGAPMTGSAGARFGDGSLARLPIVYAGELASCKPGINLAMLNPVTRSWEIIGGIVGGVSLSWSGDDGSYADQSEPDCTTIDWTIPTGYDRIYRVEVQGGIMPRTFAITGGEWVVNDPEPGESPAFSQLFELTWTGSPPGPGPGTVDAGIAFSVESYGGGDTLTGSGTIHIEYGDE